MKELTWTEIVSGEKGLKDLRIEDKLNISNEKLLLILLLFDIFVTMATLIGIIIMNN